MNEKRLVRVSDDRMVLGVAAGIARNLNLDPVIVRLAFVLLTLAGGPGLLAYIILAIIMPEEDVMVATAHGFDEEEIIIKDAD
jgi:phage shock protein C